VKIVIAADSFKGSATAVEVAEGIGRGWHSLRPDDEVVMRPMADGGEGTLDAFLRSVPDAALQPITVAGPLGEPVDTSWLLLPDGTAVVELASTSGIALLPEGRFAPLDAGTAGFGQAIDAALAAGAERVLLAVGSSCSTDAGAGALNALGARILTAGGVPIRPGARGVSTASTVDLAELVPIPARGALVLTDVTSPLVGPNGAAAVFGPQKGASSADIAVMDSALRSFAQLVAASPDEPGVGAAGGTAFGLRVWGAAIASGADAVARAIGLPGALDGADLVITGEGRFDDQSAAGKVPAIVAALAARAGVPAALVAGSIDAPTDVFAQAVSLASSAGSIEAAIQDPLPWLVRAGAHLAALA
jgi:glycerate kinase